MSVHVGISWDRERKGKERDRDERRKEDKMETEGRSKKETEGERKGAEEGTGR